MENRKSLLSYGLSVTGFARKGSKVDSELRQSPVPFLAGTGVEDQPVVGRYIEPSILLNFPVELARPPARITQRQETTGRSFAAPDRTQNIERRRQRHLAIDRHGLALAIIGRMEHKTAPG